MPMDQNATLRLRDDDVAWREFGGEGILLDLRSSTYLSANESATVLWRLLAQGTTQAELVTTLTESFGIDEQRARDDVERFLQSCRERDLLDAAK